MTHTAIKATIVRIGAGLGCFPIGFMAQKILLGRRFIRVVNYHATPASDVENFERQLDFYCSVYDKATLEDLDCCLAGVWTLSRPGIILTFDDGYRSNYDVAVPLLERYGFKGWFFLPERFLADDRAGADTAFLAANGEPEARISWSECREIASRGHVLGCHTRSHVRLSEHLPAEQLVDEITQARIDMERRIRRSVENFCWVGGEEWSYSRHAYEEILRAGYRRAFMTNLFPVLPRSSPLWIQRTNIEANWTLDQVRFYLSGIMDLSYAPKRRRVRRRLLNT
jgi:peptidoglycan/xylan/chitin deacetylase (PgdA/CDA1 family)